MVAESSNGVWYFDLPRGDAKNQGKLPRRIRACLARFDMARDSRVYKYLYGHAQDHIKGLYLCWWDAILHAQALSETVNGVNPLVSARVLIAQDKPPDPQVNYLNTRWC